MFCKNGASVVFPGGTGGLCGVLFIAMSIFFVALAIPLSSLHVFSFYWLLKSCCIAFCLSFFNLFLFCSDSMIMCKTFIKYICFDLKKQSNIIKTVKKGDRKSWADLPSLLPWFHLATCLIHAVNRVYTLRHNVPSKWRD